MNRRRADTVVGAVVAVVLLAGGTLSWRAYRQRRELEQSMGSMMDSSMGTMHGPDPLSYVFGTVLLVAVIVAGYSLVRAEVTDPDPAGDGADVDVDTTSSAASAPMDEAESSINPESNPQSRVLDLLPDDERRILEPVLDSPGITQIELRDRSDFSKSKVSQTVSSLEERGLLYREPQGRTYRVYPSDDLQRQSGA